MPDSPQKDFQPSWPPLQLPPGTFDLVTQNYGGIAPSAEFFASFERWRQESSASGSSHTAAAAEQPAEPSPPGAWSPDPAEVTRRDLPASADPRLSAIESLDLGPSGHTWARQQLDFMDSNHTAQAAGQQDRAAQPYWQTRLNLLQEANAAARQEAPGANDATAEIAPAPTPDIPATPAWAAVPELPAAPGAPDAPIAPDTPAAQIIPRSMAEWFLGPERAAEWNLRQQQMETDAATAANAGAPADTPAALAPDAPMMPGAPLTLEEVLLEDGTEAPEAPVTPLAGLLGAMALVGLIGLHPEGSFSGM